MNTCARLLVTTALWLLAALAHASTVIYVYTDPQGTPLAEADANGNITARFDHTPHGQPVPSICGAMSARSAGEATAEVVAAGSQRRRLGLSRGLGGTSTSPSDGRLRSV